MADAKSSPKQLREALQRLQKERFDLESARADPEQGETLNYSMRGLRLTSLLRQLQALQAVQGLQEVTPKAKGKTRFKIPDDPVERATLRQWLAFKADWLEALLEETIQELETLVKQEQTRQATSGDDTRGQETADGGHG